MTLLSVSGLYQYDDTIFDTLHIPAELNKDVLIAAILVECAELEILLPEPAMLKQSINYWSLAQLPIWQKLYDSTQFEYNPIWNKDGTYTETRSGTRSDNETRALNKSNLQTRDLANSSNETRNLTTNSTATRDLQTSANTTGTNQVSAYNSATFENADKNQMTGTGSDSEETEKTGTDAETTARTGTDTGTIRDTGSDTGTITRGGTDSEQVSRRETGNIGVTTTQQMIREEREVVQFSIYGYIVESFKSMYCLGVY